MGIPRASSSADMARRIHASGLPAATALPVLSLDQLAAIIADPSLIP